MESGIQRRGQTKRCVLRSRKDWNIFVGSQSSQGNCGTSRAGQIIGSQLGEMFEIRFSSVRTLFVSLGLKRSLICSSLLTDPKSRKVILVEHPLLPLYIKEMMARILFNNLQVWNNVVRKINNSYLRSTGAVHIIRLQSPTFPAGRWENYRPCTGLWLS
jgi:hypothetical protein